MLNVLIADDHGIVRKGLVQLLEEELKIDKIGEATNTNEVQHLLSQEKWHIVILDLSMPGKNGIELIKDITAEYPGLPILVLSIYPEEQFATRVMKAGASGYMTKETSTNELISAVKIIMEGRKYISSSFAEVLIKDINSQYNIPKHKQLSDREYEVFLLLVKGKNLTEIAAILSLSIKTISTYQSRIFEKMEMHSIAELVRYAIENNLSSPLS